MPGAVRWIWQLLFISCLPQCAESCFDSSGGFYCATLWYFWFCLFWVGIFLLVGVMCICNHVNKKKAKVDIQYTLPPKHRLARIAEEGKASKTTAGTSEHGGVTTPKAKALTFAASGSSSTDHREKDAPSSSTTNELQSTSANDQSTPTKPDSSAPSTTTGLKTPVTTELKTSVTPETQTPVTTETQKPVMPETKTPVTTETRTPVTTDPQTPVATVTQKPVTTELQTPVTTETQTPVTTEMRSSVSELRTPQKSVFLMETSTELGGHNIAESSA